jgi:SDR family mycofactocin-dependent oxidoreductase
MTRPPVAIVTGAARGIGAATARRLAGDGHRVVCVDACADDPVVPYPLATRSELDGVADACGGIAVVADVRSRSDMGAAVAAAEREYGQLDVVVAAAGVIVGGPSAWELTDEQWAVNLDVNLTGVWRTAAAAVPALLRRDPPRRGRIVAVASAAGTEGHPRIGAYVAAKHGVIGLVRSMAAELGHHGITVNAVSPGSTSTAILDASRDIYELGSSEEFAVHHAVGRLITAEEVASGIAWLCAAEQGGVTGIALPVDGGMTV